MASIWAVKLTHRDGRSEFIPVNGYKKIDGHFILDNGKPVPNVSKLPPTPEQAIFSAQAYQNGFLGQFGGHQYTAEKMELPPANHDFSSAHRLPSNADCVAAMDAESYPAQKYGDGPNIGKIFFIVVLVLAALVALLNLLAPNIA